MLHQTQWKLYIKSKYKENERTILQSGRSIILKFDRQYKSNSQHTTTPGLKNCIDFLDTPSLLYKVFGWL